MPRPLGIGPQHSLEELHAHFKNLSRAPFVEILADLIKCAPTKEAVHAFAQEHPDKWVNTVRTMARLSGYHDQLEITENVNIMIQSMGDTELESTLAALEQEILDLPEHEYAEVLADDQRELAHISDEDIEGPAS